MHRIFIVLIVLSSCSIIEPNYLNLSKEKQSNYLLLPVDSISQSEKGIYSINSEGFLSVLNKDTTNYKLLIFFTYWCPNSAEFFPTFISEIQDSCLTTFFISPDDWIYKKRYETYINNFNLKRNIYLLDVYQYGEKRNPHYRMGKFISEICTDCSEIKGFPSFIMFNPKNEIIYKKVGAVSFDTVVSLMDE